MLLSPLLRAPCVSLLSSSRNILLMPTMLQSSLRASFFSTGSAASSAATPSVPTPSPFTPQIQPRSGTSPDSVVHVTCTMNNIHACISNLDGQVISKASGGLLGFKHRERASADAAKSIGETISKKAVEAGYRLAHVKVSGPSRGRSSMLRGLVTGGLRIADIRDVTPMPTNGCRPPAMRRL